MRILLQNNFYEPFLIGGAERSVQYLAEGLSNKGHEVHVVTLGNEEVQETKNGVFLHRVKSKNVYWAFEGRPALLRPLWHLIDRYNSLSGRDVRKVIERVKPEVFHTNNLAGVSVSAWSVAAAAKVPIVHTLRDYYLLCPSANMFRGGKACDRPCGTCQFWAKRRGAETHNVSVVVGNSQRILDIHRANGAFKNVRGHVVYSAFPKPERNSSKLKRSGEGLRVGYFGQLTPSKGVMELVKAIENINEGTQLLVGGEGPRDYVESLKSMSGSKVKFLGRSAPSDFFPNIDVLIVPSLWEEPLPRVAIEAHSFGVPVITSDRGGTPEIISEGKTGWVVSANGLTQNLEETISRLKIEDIDKMRDACVSSSATFDPLFVSLKYEELYREAIDLSVKKCAS